MKTKLSGLDRINIPKILPKEGSIIQQQVVREILEKTVIKTEEFKEYDLKEDHINQRITWDVEKIKEEKEFDLNKSHTQVLKEAIEKIDKAGKISQQMLETALRIQAMR